MKKEILILEDDDLLREFLTELLEENDYRVITSSNGLEGLERLTLGFKPDLILLDYRMPKMDGIAFRKAQLQNALWASIPTLLLSGDILKDFSLFGRQMVMPKPFNIISLIDRMSSLLN
jgi:two-component system alkaline phosphatase synthesis response regulator PhoP